MQWERWEIADDLFWVIQGAAARYGVPPRLLMAVVAFESGLRPGARGDRGALSLCQASVLETYAVRDPAGETWGADADGYCSFGLAQLNHCCGVGVGHRITDLLDAGYNVDVAARVMRTRRDRTDDWWAALEPWSVRAQAWELAEGVPHGGGDGRTPAPGSGPAAIAPGGPSEDTTTAILSVIGLLLVAEALLG